MIDRPLVTNAAENEREKAADDGVESSVSDAAQQLSAWACVTTLSEPAPDSVDPCMGQLPLVKQQAIRASGEVCQPAHSAHPAAASTRATTKAAVRLRSSPTFLGCMGATLVSIQWGTGAQKCTVARGAAVRARNVPARVSYDVTICLFRVVQEGLNNVVKHQRRARGACEPDRQGRDNFVEDSRRRSGVRRGQRSRFRWAGAREHARAPAIDVRSDRHPFEAGRRHNDRSARVSRAPAISVRRPLAPVDARDRRRPIDADARHLIESLRVKTSKVPRQGWHAN
jgi:hypothetical protein